MKKILLAAIIIGYASMIVKATGSVFIDDFAASYARVNYYLQVFSISGIFILWIGMLYDCVHRKFPSKKLKRRLAFLISLSQLDDRSNLLF